MTWLNGLAPISGPRWSCGAYWAEDGNPQASDTDWGDSSTWDAAHVYDADAAISLGVFVGGDDVTSLVRGASWGLGQSEPLPSSLQPSSGSITLKGSSSAVAGDRVVILTEWDVLYVATVAATAVTTDVERTETTLSMEDELARVAIADWPEGVTLGGTFDSMMTTLLGLADIGAPWLGVPEMAYPFGQFNVTPAERSGTVLAVMGTMVRNALSMAAWTPQGIRVNTTDLVYLDETDRGWPDVDVTSLAAFSSYTITRDPGRVVNETTVTDLGTTTGDTWPESIEAYGRRPLAEYDLSEWSQQATAMAGYIEAILEGSGEAAFIVPLPWFAGQARIVSKRHAIARLLPFDHVMTGHPYNTATTRYRVLRTSHSLTPDSWSVSLEGVLVRANEDYPSTSTLSVEFNGTPVEFNGTPVVQNV